MAIKDSYDTLASEYTRRVSDELQGKPLDRALLDEVAARADGLICDLGCGPGHAARYLDERGAAACGVDLSPGMIAEARRLNPTLPFEVGDMRSLALGDGSLAAIVAMYSLIHFEQGDLARACAEISRTLARNGLLLAGFHRGSGTEHMDELWGHQVDLDFHYFDPEDITPALARAGLTVERVVEREPYPGVEAPTRRFYVLARKATEAEP